MNKKDIYEKKNYLNFNSNIPRFKPELLFFEQFLYKLIYE